MMLPNSSVAWLSRAGLLTLLLVGHGDGVAAKEPEVTVLSAEATGTIKSLKDLAIKTAAVASNGDELDDEQAVHNVPENPGQSFLPPAIAAGSLDGALDDGSTTSDQTIPPNPNMSFEGISNAQQAPLVGGFVLPPDPVGDVGKEHYVQMVNLALGIYNKADGSLAQPIITLGDIWSDEIPACGGNAGDPIVLHDQFEDRWLLSQFTTGCLSSSTPCYICLAISKTGDPTGGYNLFAIETQPDPSNSPGGTVFPDYPKYSIWSDTIVITTRDFARRISGQVAVSVYAFPKEELYSPMPPGGTRLPGGIRFVIPKNEAFFLIGDGLLPADIDGDTLPPPGSPIPIFGDQDDDAWGPPVKDVVNVWELSVDWSAKNEAQLSFTGSLPVAPMSTFFPCGPSSRDCLPQPGITNRAQYLDVQSYRQRLLHRLAYRNFGSYESIVATRAVEARSFQAGMRWYEIRRNSASGMYSIAQQGTYAPDDGIDRWMGSIAQDKAGNIALGYSVVNGANASSPDAVFPGIRYTGRLADDPLGVMTLGEADLAVGSGVQLDTASRWGDYSSMNIDPTDDCTFWYTNEYYTAEGQNISSRGWQTRIGSFILPGCKSGDEGTDTSSGGTNVVIPDDEESNGMMSKGIKSKGMKSKDMKSKGSYTSKGTTGMKKSESTEKMMMMMIRE